MKFGNKYMQIDLNDITIIDSILTCVYMIELIQK